MNPADLRFRKYQRGSALPLKDSIDKDPVLPVADHVEVGRLVVDLDVTPGDEGRVAHVHVHVAFRRVPADHDPVLPDHVLKFPGLQFSDRVRRRPVGSVAIIAVRVGSRWTCGRGLES